MGELKFNAVCIVLRNYPDPTFGGIERVSFLLARYFKKLGIKVFFLCQTKRPRNFGEDVECFVLPQMDVGRFYEKFFLENRVDIAIFQGVSPVAPLPRPVKGVAVYHVNPGRWNDSTIIGHIDSSNRLSSLHLSLLKCFLKTYVPRKLLLNWFRFWEGRFFRKMLKSDSVVLLSNAYFSDFLRIAGVEDSQKKLSAIHNPSPYGSINIDFSKKEKRVLWVGRLQNAQKRVDLLLKIWKKVESKFPEWRLDIVGNGIDEKRLKNLALEMGLGHVVFYGNQSPEGFYERASIFALTSEWEGFGMVLVEAAAYGCIPVAFDSYAAAGDIISDGKNGFLIPAFDCEKYASILSDLMDNGYRRNSMMKASQEISKKFSLEKIGAQWMELFSKILSEGEK